GYTQAMTPRKTRVIASNSHRFDPYKNFKFRVKMGGRHVAGIAEVSGLTRATGLADYRESGSTARKLPGIQKYPNLTLKRGVTRDAEFMRWATAVVGEPPKDFRKDIVVEMCDERGAVAVAYKVRRCWVSKIQGMDFNAEANEVAIESLTLENDGFELI